MNEKKAYREVETSYKKTKLGWIPKEWSYEKLNRKVDILTGYPFSSKNYTDNGIKLLRGANIKRGYIDWENGNTVYWGEQTDELEKYLLQENDLIIAMDGSLVGRSYGQINRSDLPAYLLQRVARLRSKKIDIKFLKHIVSSRIFVNYCDSIKTVTAIPHISTKDIKNFRIPIPPLSEQKKIAEILSTWDRAIETLDQLIAKKEELKRGLMQELLSGNTRFPGFEGEWKEIKLNKLITTLSGGTPSRSKPEYYNGVIPWIKSGELNTRRIYTTEESISSEGLEKSSARLVDKHTLLLAIYGATAGVISVNMIEKAAINQAVLALIPRNDKVDQGFLELWFSFNKDRIVHTFTQGGQPNLSAKIVKGLKIECPKIEEQRKISKLLFSISEEIEETEKIVEAINIQKKGLMQHLLTGKTRVQA